MDTIHLFRILCNNITPIRVYLLESKDDPVCEYYKESYEMNYRKSCLLKEYPEFNILDFTKELGTTVDGLLKYINNRTKEDENFSRENVHIWFKMYKIASKLEKNSLNAIAKSLNTTVDEIVDFYTLNCNKYSEDINFFNKLLDLLNERLKKDNIRQIKAMHSKEDKTAQYLEFYQQVNLYLNEGKNFVEIDKILFSELPNSDGSHSRSKYFNICKSYGLKNLVDEIYLNWFNKVNELLSIGYTKAQIYEKIGTPLNQNFDKKGVESLRECYRRLKAKFGDNYGK